jgi:hypothetical protein
MTVEVAGIPKQNLSLLIEQGDKISRENIADWGKPFSFTEADLDELYFNINFLRVTVWPNHGENATALVFDVVRGFLVHLGPGGYGQATRCRSQHRLPAARTSVAPRMNQAARTAPAAARNREPILRVLRDCLPPSARVRLWPISANRGS